MARDDEDDVNLVDTNGAPGAMDEDGEFIEEGDEEAEETQPSVDDNDTSSGIKSLTMSTYHLTGHPEPQTKIEAVIPSPTGFVTKSITLPGLISAQRLADLISGVSDW